MLNIIFQKYIIIFFVIIVYILNIISFVISIYSIQFEESDYINKNNKFFLKADIIQKFNSFLKLCKNGKLIDKTKYPLLKHPKITIIIPVYNGGKYLNYSLRTIQNQKLKEIEIILIDDCSTDDSLININKLMKEDPRIRLIKNYKNRKILYSKSIGALNSNGDYILELDQDDMFIREDLFDIIYHESQKHNLDLVQFRDFIKDDFYFERKTKINVDKSHWIFPKKTFYMEEPELKETLFKNQNNYLLWGLLILSKLYKKAIYILWEFIINYEFIFNEDYIITTMIIMLAHNYKYLNIFGLIHLKHQQSISFDCIKKEIFHLSNLFFVVYLNDYYVKKKPENVHLIYNYLLLNKFYQTQASHIFKRFFDFNIRIFLFNNYLLENNKQEIFDSFNINSNKSFSFSSYSYIMDSKDFHSIYNYQNLIFNISKKKNNNITNFITNKKYLTRFNRIHINFVYINDSNSNSDNNEIIKLKNKKSTYKFIKYYFPKISIIIYCNEIKYLEQTLISIVEQKYFFSFEIIIVYDNLNIMCLSDNFNYNNIIIINNQNQRGIMYSFSKGILASKGKYILLFLSGYTLAKNNILNNLYKIAKYQEIDILEFNLLINKDDEINKNSFYLYKCHHFNSSLNTSQIKYNQNYKEIDQEKELLINKLIRSKIYKDIINKYKLFADKEVIYNTFDDILNFLLNKKRYVFKHIDLFGVIKNNNQVNSLKLNDLINDEEQKINDTIFYLNFLFDNTRNKYKDKKVVYDEFVNILGLAYNKLALKSTKSINLFQKFMKSKSINEIDKSELLFFYKSLNN